MNVYYLISAVWTIGVCASVWSCSTREESTDDTGVEPYDTQGVDAGDTDTEYDIEQSPSLFEAYDSFFSIGAAVEPSGLRDMDALVAHHFNRLTAENAMKPESTQPSKGKFDFDRADIIADYAREQKMQMTGHVLVWHKQTPKWMFSDLEAGNAEDIETLKGRMKTHIETVVTRYHDVVDNWDVVNEAISDELTEVYRTDSDWYRIFGSEAYIYWAFKYAKDALEAIETGASNGRLYYNDFDCSVKSNKILTLLDWLESEKDIKIDGVGIQGHWGIDFPSDFSIQRTIDKFASAGYAVKISELDLTIYNDYVNGPTDVEEEKEFTADVEQLQAERYGQIFALLRDNSDRITSVTLWGVTDGGSWMNNKVKGRSDYPLLFDDDLMPKEAFNAVVEF